MQESSHCGSAFNSSSRHQPPRTALFTYLFTYPLLHPSSPLQQLITLRVAPSSPSIITTTCNSSSRPPFITTSSCGLPLPPPPCSVTGPHLPLWWGWGVAPTAPCLRVGRLNTVVVYARVAQELFARVLPLLTASPHRSVVDLPKGLFIE